MAGTMAARPIVSHPPITSAGISKATIPAASTVISIGSTAALCASFRTRRSCTAQAEAAKSPNPKDSIFVLSDPSPLVSR
jgi:hypothetical protein